MNRSGFMYLVLHYLLLIGLIFVMIASLERVGLPISLWSGILIAITIGVLYPIVIRAAGVAPKQWES